jgi:hypothetical protein
MFYRFIWLSNCFSISSGYIHCPSPPAWLVLCCVSVEDMHQLPPTHLSPLPSLPPSQVLSRPASLLPLHPAGRNPAAGSQAVAREGLISGVTYTPIPILHRSPHTLPLPSLLPLFATSYSIALSILWGSTLSPAWTLPPLAAIDKSPPVDPTTRGPLVACSTSGTPVGAWCQ